MNGTTLIDVCADFVGHNAAENTLIVTNDEGKPVTFSEGTFKFDDVDKLHAGENFIFKAQEWIAEIYGF